MFVFNIFRYEQKKRILFTRILTIAFGVQMVKQMDCVAICS